MRVAVLGTGDVGRSLGNGFLALGHDVRMGAREATNTKAIEWVKAAGERASNGTFADAVAWAELIVLATLGLANEAVIKSVPAEAFNGKILIDATNPLDFSGGFPPALKPSGNDSGGELVQRLVPNAHVVKAFNTVNNSIMCRPPAYTALAAGEKATMFFAGNDAGAKTKVAAILTEFGWEPIDVGDIRSSRYLEGLCLLWVMHYVRTKTANHAFKLVQK